MTTTTTTTTMRRLPGFWLPLALAVLITSRCATGYATRSQLHKVIEIILFEDKLYEDVLSELVKLDDNDALPPCVKHLEINLDEVDPLVTLFALTSTHPHYSGDNLDLSVAIIGKSITCLTHKRVALHLALIIRLIQDAESRVHFQTRSNVFAHTIPYSMDLLSSINKKYDKLLKVYDLVFRMVSPSAAVGATDYDGHISVLKKELEILNQVIESSCVVNKMKDYCDNLDLKELDNCADMITEEQLISDTMKPETAVKSLKENENAIMDLFEEMDMLRSMDMDAWKFWLKTPELLNGDPDKFTRTPPIRYADVVEDIIDERGSSVFNKENHGKPADKGPESSIIPVQKISSEPAE